MHEERERAPLFVLTSDALFHGGVLHIRHILQIRQLVFVKIFYGNFRESNIILSVTHHDSIPLRVRFRLNWIGFQLNIPDFM